MADVHLDDVRVALEGEVPHVVEDLGLRHDLAGAPHQELEHRELARGERDVDVAAAAPVRDRVEGEVAGGVDDRARSAGAPEQRAQPGEEHDERERLGEEVVGAGVERLGLVVLAVLGGEHEDRRPVAAVAQLLAHLVAVDARQHDVEHDRVVRVLGRHPEPVGAGERDVDGEALGLQPAPDRRRRPSSRPRR